MSDAAVEHCYLVEGFCWSQRRANDGYNIHETQGMQLGRDDIVDMIR
jgi:hypothetical protein